MKTIRQLVYDAIDGERDYQASRWNENTTTTKGLHTVDEFVLYMIDYIEEARRQLSRNASPLAQQLALDTVRKVAAMGVACMEQNGAPQREGYER